MIKHKAKIHIMAIKGFKRIFLVINLIYIFIPLHQVFYYRRIQSVVWTHIYPPVLVLIPVSGANQCKSSKVHVSEAYSQGLCVRVWLCHHAGIIKVIDLPCSIMRAGAATVTFGRKCHSTLNDDSDDRPYFGGHFSNTDTLFCQKPGRESLTQQSGERGGGGGAAGRGGQQ